MQHLDRKAAGQRLPSPYAPAEAATKIPRFFSLSIPPSYSGPLFCCWDRRRLSAVRPYERDRNLRALSFIGQCLRPLSSWGNITTSRQHKLCTARHICVISSQLRAFAQEHSSVPCLLCHQPDDIVFLIITFEQPSYLWKKERYALFNDSLRIYTTQRFNSARNYVVF